MFLLVDTRDLLAPDAGPALGYSRGRVLDLLRDADAPLTAADVARQCGLHPNTARFHLDALTEAGLAARETVRRNMAQGRPSVGYRVAGAGQASAPSGERRYRLLAEMLASLVAGLVDNPAATAERAGREWGGFLAGPPPPYQRPSATEALAGLTGLLAGIGFDPQATTGKEVLLRACPFREVAREHQEVVCSLHLGVIRGALDRMRAPLAADRLEVFPEPGLCRVHLTIPGKDEPREQAR